MTNRIFLDLRTVTRDTPGICFKPDISSTHIQPFYGSLDFAQDNPGEPVPEETFTHLHISWSSIIPYLLPPSTMIHGILSVQLMCLTVFFHNLSPSFLWSPLYLEPSTSYSIHFFTQSVFAAHAHTTATGFAVVPRLSHLMPAETVLNHQQC